VTVDPLGIKGGVKCVVVLLVADGDMIVKGGADMIVTSPGGCVGEDGDIVGKVETTLWRMLAKGVAWSKARQ